MMSAAEGWRRIAKEVDKFNSDAKLRPNPRLACFRAFVIP